MADPRNPSAPQIRHLIGLAALLLAPATLMAACDSDKPGANAPQNSAAAPAKTGNAAERGTPDGEGKTKVVDGTPPGKDERYSLVIDTPDAKAGQEATVKVRVVPKAPWHMNLDFPTSLKIEAPAGLTFANADMKKADATKLDEGSCEFDVKFTPASAGESKFTGKFKFAVCQDEACSPVTENVEVQVAVK
jgi:hypothetical protein